MNQNSVNPNFGTEANLQALSSALHSRGMVGRLPNGSTR